MYCAAYTRCAFESRQPLLTDVSYKRDHQQAQGHGDQKAKNDEDEASEPERPIQQRVPAIRVARRRVRHVWANVSDQTEPMQSIERRGVPETARHRDRRRVRLGLATRHPGD